MLRQRVGLSIAAALFVAACAAVPAATGGEVSVLGEEIGSVAVVEPTVDPFTLDPLVIRRPVGRPTPSTVQASAAPDDAPADDTATGGLPDHLADSEPTAAELALAAVPPVDTVPPTTAAPAPPPAPAPAPRPAPTTTAPPPPPTTAAPAPPPTAPPTTTAPPPPPTTAPPAADSGARSSFVAEINSLRASVGVGGLTRSGDLDARAQAWADVMARDDWLRHSAILGDLVAGSWSAAGENVGYGPSVSSIFGGLRGSSGHYANMVKGAYTHVGVGVVVIDGVMWTAHLFAG